MDVYIFSMCFGIFYLIPVRYGTNFQAEPAVIFSDVNLTCQRSNGTHFNLDKLTFVLCVFPNEKFVGDSSVAATYSFVSNPEIHFRLNKSDAIYRCIAFEIQKDCTVRYWHKACNESFGIVCESGSDEETTNDTIHPYHLYSTSMCLIGTDATNSATSSSTTKDTGLIIGSVHGGIVFLLFVVLLTFIFMKKMLQKPRRTDITKQNSNKKDMRLNKTLDPANSVDKPDDIILQPQTTNDGSVSATGYPDEYNGVIVEDISEPNNSTHSYLELESDDTTYTPIRAKTIVTINDITNSNRDSYDNLDYKKDTVSETLTRNVYDRANFHLRDVSESHFENSYDTTEVDSDKASQIHYGEYDMTYIKRSNRDCTYDHV